MCLAVPGRLLSCSHHQAVADLHGTRLTVSTILIPDALPGDWVLIHAGFAIQRIDPTDVNEIWATVNRVQGAPANDEQADSTLRGIK